MRDQSGDRKFGFLGIENAFQIPPLVTTVLLVALAAVIVLRKNATVRVLDIMVPVMAVFYLLITFYIILTNITTLPGVFQRIFEEAFGIRQVVSGGLGAVIMNGAKRGLFSNEAGSGSAPVQRRQQTAATRLR